MSVKVSYHFIEPFVMQIITQNSVFQFNIHAYSQIIALPFEFGVRSLDERNNHISRIEVKPLL